MPVLRVRSGPQKGLHWRLNRSTAARIGSDSGCEIHLTGVDGIERRHAVVHYVTGRWLIEALGAEGLRINENAPVRLAWLEPDDRIELLPAGLVLEFLSSSLKRAKGRREKDSSSRSRGSPPAMPAKGAPGEGPQPQLDDVTRRMMWPALACGGVVAVSAATALAVVVLAAMVLFSQEGRRAETRPGETPAVPKSAPLAPKDDQPPSSAPSEPADRPPTTGAEPQAPVPQPPSDSAPDKQPAAPAPANGTPAPPSAPPAPVASTPAPPPSEAISPQFLKFLEAGVFLIEVTDPAKKKSAPFGTAWAIGERQLITTAGQAVELDRFLKENWRVVAVRQSDGGRVAVTRAAVHPEFTKLSGQRAQLFYDVGLLTILSPTTLVYERMSADEIQRLDSGLTIMCLGIPHGYDPMASAPSLLAQPFAGKLHLVEALSPGGPALLHLNLDVPEQLEGSPILTADGKVIGTYIRSAPPEVQKKIGFPLQAATSVTAAAELLPQK
ncbi:MAG: hypothetical protein HY000_23915 [Planctomycetes bacterium]|nr:hypothetical protein [Planctomycetota bacterium]